MPLTFRSKAKTSCLIQVRGLATKLRLGQASPSSTSDSSSKTGTSGAGLSNAYQAWEQSPEASMFQIWNEHNWSDHNLVTAQFMTVYETEVTNWNRLELMTAISSSHKPFFNRVDQLIFTTGKKKRDHVTVPTNSLQNRQHPLSLALLLPPWL